MRKKRRAVKPNDCRPNAVEVWLSPKNSWTLNPCAEIRGMAWLCAIEKERDIFVMMPAGRLEDANADLFLNEMTRLTDSPCDRFVIDFSAVSFIGSSSLRALLVMHKKLRPIGGRITLCGMSQGIKEVFDITAFSSHFEIFDTRFEAIEDLKQNP